MNYTIHTVLSAVFLLLSLTAWAGQNPSTPPSKAETATPSEISLEAGADWAAMEGMVEKKWQKRLVRKLEKIESRKQASNHPQARSWLVALLLAIFLGYLGIDRFYLGYPIWGLIKLFTGGLLGIMWILDIILIATFILRPKNGGY